MLIATLSFWESLSDMLQLMCGMITPTLMDIGSITGVRPIGETNNPSRPLNHNFKFLSWRVAFINYLFDQHDANSYKVSDEERMAFWLYVYPNLFFCLIYLQVALGFLPLVIQLHEGRDVSLSRLIMAKLYDLLGDVSHHL